MTTTATVRVSYHILRELLRLPPGVEILGVSPAVGDSCVLTVSGAGSGELVAGYSYRHETIVHFAGFTRP